MSAFSGVINLFQYLVADIVFFYACPRRKHFLWRLLIAIPIATLLVYFFPRPEAWQYNPIYGFIRFFCIFMISVAVPAISFDLKFSVSLALSAGGGLLQHISFRLATMTAFYLNAGETELITNEFWSYFECFMCFLVDVVAFFTLGRYIKKREYYKNNDRRLNLLGILTVFICNVLTRFARQEELTQSLTVNLYAVMCCLLALILQFAVYRNLNFRSENEAIKEVWKKEVEQNRITKEMIDNINVKVHDMKHWINTSSSSLDSEKDYLTQLIDRYAGSLKTGNPVIDTVLMDYSLRYERDRITISFSGNAERLSFMGEADILSFFGNLLSNAVEAVQKLEDEGKKRITIKVIDRGDLIAINAMNFFNGEIKKEGDTLLTTKENAGDRHGYGVRSMREIAQKYGGDLHTVVKYDVFNVNAFVCRG